MNKVILVGRLTRPVEHRQINDDVRVAKFTVVTEEGVKNKETGKWEKKSTFHEVDAWNNRAKFMENFDKGSVIEVEGSIFNDNYVDKETGKKVYKNRIRADRLDFLPREYSNEPVGATSETPAEDAPF